MASKWNIGAKVFIKIYPLLLAKTVYQPNFVSNYHLILTRFIFGKQI
jgi:hypothetical protein